MHELAGRYGGTWPCPPIETSLSEPPASTGFAQSFQFSSTTWCACVRDANMGHHLAGGNSSWCPKLDVWTTHLPKSLPGPGRFMALPDPLENHLQRTSIATPAYSCGGGYPSGVTAAGHGSLTCTSIAVSTSVTAAAAGFIKSPSIRAPIFVLPDSR